MEGKHLPLPPAMNGTQWGQATMARSIGELTHTHISYRTSILLLFDWNLHRILALNCTVECIQMHRITSFKSFVKIFLQLILIEPNKCEK